MQLGIKNSTLSPLCTFPSSVEAQAFHQSLGGAKVSVDMPVPYAYSFETGTDEKIHIGSPALEAEILTLLPYHHNQNALVDHRCRSY